MTIHLARIRSTPAEALDGVWFCAYYRAAIGDGTFRILAYRDNFRTQVRAETYLRRIEMLSRTWTHNSGYVSLTPCIGRVEVKFTDEARLSTPLNFWARNRIIDPTKLTGYKDLGICRSLTTQPKGTP